MDINTQKCPNCAGVLNTIAEEKKKICPYCESEFYIGNGDKLPTRTLGNQGSYPNIQKQQNVELESRTCSNKETMFNENSLVRLSIERLKGLKSYKDRFTKQ